MLDPVTSDRYTLGVWIGIPVTVLIIIMLLVVGVFSAHSWREEKESHGERTSRRSALVGPDLFWFFTKWGSFAAIPVVMITFAAIWWPFDAEYHTWRPVRGEVSSSEKRIYSASKDSGPSELFVVQYVNGEQYRCDDTRCASIKPGNVAELTCKKEWQFTGTDGRVCKFISLEP
jgi:hypothetical protein